MRPNQQNKNRMRSRNNQGGGGGRKGPNPLTRTYESNGPDIKIRGNAHHVAEKYLQLARDAQTSGDPVMAESYLQHAEHYFRLIAAAQLAQLQAQPGYVRPINEAEAESEDDDEDGTGLPDRFASLPDRFSQQAPQPPVAPQPAPERQGSERQGSERPLQERPPYNGQDGGQRDQPRYERNNQNGQDRNFRPNYQDRNQNRDFRNNRDQQRPRTDGQRFDQNRDNRQDGNRGDGGRRETQGEAWRGDQPRDNRPESRAETQHETRPQEHGHMEMTEQPSLPSFITAPVRSFVPEPETAAPKQASDGYAAEPARRQARPSAADEQPETSVDAGDDAGEFHLRPRRRRRPRAAEGDTPAGSDTPIAE